MLGKFFDIYNRLLLYYCDVYCWWFLIYWNYVLILSFFFLIFFLEDFFAKFLIVVDYFDIIEVVDEEIERVKEVMYGFFVFVNGNF